MTKSTKRPATTDEPNLNEPLVAAAVIAYLERKLPNAPLTRTAR
jgi:hypothetical protein